MFRVMRRQKRWWFGGEIVKEKKNYQNQDEKIFLTQQSESWVGVQIVL
jgi:hypothetical protein